VRILIITDKVPYPVISGAPLRTYNLLRRVAREHEVWLAAMTETPEQVAGIAHLQQFCRGVEVADGRQLSALARPAALLRYLLSGRPPELRLYFSQDLVERIQRLIASVDFDLIQIEHSHMALYLDAIPARLQEHAVLMLHDVVFQQYDRIARLEPRGARRLRLRLYSRSMRRWEPRFAGRFARCVTVSQADRQLLLAKNPRLRVDVVPNGVDTERYQPLPEEGATPALIFVGNMDFTPCVDAAVHFCRHVLPRIRRAVPGVQLWIVGKSPRAEVVRLAGEGVHVTGLVDDVRPYYERSTVAVVPLRAGGGTRLKILEAMALGRPVVSTRIGCEGLDLVDGEHLFVTDEPAQFAERTVRLLNDGALRRSMTGVARRHVVCRYDWNGIAEGLMRIYAETAGRLEGVTR
jgi:sugar transferase (PEP-CTERM/EpsH1 system associated)